jgi:hypothetical protein
VASEAPEGLAGRGEELREMRRASIELSAVAVILKPSAESQHHCKDVQVGQFGKSFSFHTLS